MQVEKPQDEVGASYGVGEVNVGGEATGQGWG